MTSRASFRWRLWLLSCQLVAAAQIGRVSASFCRALPGNIQFIGLPLDLRLHRLKLAGHVRNGVFRCLDLGRLRENGFAMLARLGRPFSWDGVPSCPVDISAFYA